MDKSAIYVAYGQDALELGRTLIKAAGATTFFRPGRSVAVKPNLVVAKPASSGATTHVGFAEAVFEAARDFGVTDLRIIEGSWVGADTKRAFAVAGYDELAKRFGAKLVDLRRDDFARVQFAGESALVCKSALDVDVLVNLPVLKAHCQTRVTCAVKNLKGCIPDSEKRRYHAEGLMHPISLLPGLVKTAFTLVDGICGDLTFEEGGTPIPMHRAFIGADPLRIDAYAVQLLGLSARDVPYLEMAERHGLGKAEPGEVKVVGDTQTAPVDVKGRDGFAFVRHLTKKVSEKGACSACYGSLVHALNQLDEERRAVNAPIAIGQGYQGQSGEGIGIGRCCSGFACSVPGCPPDARAIAEALRKLG